MNFTSSNETDLNDDDGFGLMESNLSTSTTTESPYFISINDDPELARCASMVLREELKVS